MIMNGTAMIVQYDNAMRKPDTRTVMQEPAKECDLADIQEMIPLPYIAINVSEGTNCDKSTRTWFHVNVFSLHTHQIHAKGNKRKDETDRAAPPDDRCAEQVVLRLIIAPAAHAKTDFEEGPLRRSGGEDVEFVGIGNESVVRSHHGDVEMPEVAEEG